MNPSLRRRLLLGAALPLGAAAKGLTVRMAFGEKIPPFCFPQTASGIEVDVFREALALRGHTLEPLFFPFARVPLEFKAGTVDATMTDLGQDLTQYGGHHGDTAVVYDNVLITLRERALKLRQPRDLDGLRVVSFPGALSRFPAWLEPVRAAGHYSEINDQAVHVRLLMLGRCDVVLSDRTIFRYFVKQAAREPAGPALRPVVEQDFTQVNPLDYRPVFRSTAVRDDFNAGLRLLKANGRFQAIYDRYLRV
jgi:polar amino acid transport system substrate-binding protein